MGEEASARPGTLLLFFLLPCLRFFYLLQFMRGNCLGFRNPLTGESVENESQSGKHSYCKRVQDFKNIKHPKQQKCGCKVIAQKMSLIRQSFM
jgi:hypothetical protein